MFVGLFQISSVRSLFPQVAEIMGFVIDSPSGPRRSELNFTFSDRTISNSNITLFLFKGKKMEVGAYTDYEEY